MEVRVRASRAVPHESAATTPSSSGDAVEIQLLKLCRSYISCVLYSRHELDRDRR